jgi:undecaprenyl-diphosphatase
VADFLKAIILGAVEGLTEFAPVSSTAHLVVAQRALGLSASGAGLRLDAAAHLGALAAVLLYFRRTIGVLAAAWLASVRAGNWLLSGDSRLAWFLIVSALPGVLAGLLLQSTLDDAARRPVLVGLVLIVFSLPLLLAGWLGHNHRHLDGLGFRDAAVIGASQALALFPGVSRAGITIAAGMLAGFRREQAAIYAFLLSVPVIAAAGASQLVEALGDPAAAGPWPHEVFIAATALVVAAVAGYAAIAWLLSYLRHGSLSGFVVYRVVAGCLILVLAAAGRL